MVENSVEKSKNKLTDLLPLESPNKASKKSVSSKAMTLILGFFTACSRLLGFVRQIVFTSVFGAGAAADVFNFAFNVPNNLRKLLAEGALSSAYIPVLSGALEEKKERKEVAKIVRTVITFQLIIVIPLVLLLSIGAPVVVNLLSKFEDPQQVTQAVSIFRYLIFYLLLVSISAVIMGTLNSDSKFVIPGLTPILFSVSVIGSVLLLHKHLGLYSMVVGVLVGGVAQILFQLPQFYKRGFSLRPLLDFKTPEFRKIMLRYGPVVISSGVFMLLQMFAQFLGSMMDKGSISAISNSLVIWQLPFGIFSVSIMTVLFPRMSRQSHSNDRDGLKDSIEEGLSGFIAFIVPSSIFLFMAANFIVSTIYMRNNFTAANVPLTSHVLQAYSVGIVSVSAFQFLQRFFYADHSYLIPFISAILVAIIDVLFSVFFYYRGWGAVGLAWANTFAYSIGFIFLWICASYQLKGIHLKGLFKTSLKVALSLVPMVAVLAAFNLIFPELWMIPNDLYRLLILIALALCCTLPVLLLYLLFKVEVFSDIILSRFKRKRG